MHFAGPAPVIPGSSIPISLGSPLILHDNTECFFSLTLFFPFI